jgi:protein-S-isoprenylcysteine O-methyltransferase Ste14
MFIRLLLWIIMLVGGGALGIYLDWQWFRPLFLNPIFHLITLILGLILLKFVMQVSRYTGRLLAQRGREGDIPRMDTNKLVTDDIYNCMRHPMHLGLLFFPWAVALILGSPTFILFIAPLEMVFMVVLIKLVEEREAIHKFGDDYRQYQARTPMFNLRPSCLRMLLQEPLPKRDVKRGA